MSLPVRRTRSARDRDQQVATFFRAKQRIDLIEAASDPDVMAFRSKQLKGCLVAVDGVREWIESRLRCDGPPGTRLSLLLPARTTIGGTATQWREQLAAVLSQARVLDHSADTTVLVLRTGGIRVNARGDLAVLKRVALSLSRFDWREWDAIEFILSGRQPEYPRRGVRFETICSPGRIFPDRVLLEASADARAQDVESAFIRGRRYPSAGPRTDEMLLEDLGLTVVGIDRRTSLQGPRRSKFPNPRHCQLAVFVAQQIPRQTWGQRMHAWNEEYPRWRYADEEQFRQEARAAYERVTGRSFPRRTSLGRSGTSR